MYPKINRYKVNSNNPKSATKDERIFHIDFDEDNLPPPKPINKPSILTSSLSKLSDSLFNFSDTTAQNVDEEH